MYIMYKYYNVIIMSTYNVIIILLHTALQSPLCHCSQGPELQAWVISGRGLPQ